MASSLLSEKYCSNDRRLIVSEQIPAALMGGETLPAGERELQSHARKNLWKTKVQHGRWRACNLRCCAKLLVNFSFSTSGVHLMESGTASSTRRNRVFPIVLIVILVIAGLAAAQQPATGTPSSQSSPTTEPPAGTPQGLPLVQPLPQAAVRADQAATGAQAKNAGSKEVPDQSALTKLGPGDLIEINVYNVPELATKARVSNSGDVYLPLIDYVHVDGLTQEEAQTVIEKRLEDGGFVRNPHVTIFVDEAASQGVAVLGEVAKPGIYPDVVDHKLYEVISEAGGFTPNASRKVAIIRHNLPDAMHIELPRNLADDLSGNVDVLPGDTITVPRAPIIYVVGDVGRPSGLLVDNGTLTVLQAIALAGGTNRTAKMGAARILRKTPSGMTETRIELKKMLEAKTPDITLQADDILFVPVSGFRLAASRTAEAALTMATAVSIYAVHP
jgi:polysaccharide export outer membrane protein